MAFRDLDDFLGVEPIVLPILGKDYTFPGDITARSGLRLQLLNERLRQARAGAPGDDIEPGAVVLTDEDEAQLRIDLFGDTEAEMVADGLSVRHITITYWTLIAYHLYGKEAAEAYWNAQGETPAPSRTTRRSKTPAPPAPDRGSRASSSVAKRTAAKSSSGRKSSTVGSS